jgi:hypothetical protein
VLTVPRPVATRHSVPGPPLKGIKLTKPQRRLLMELYERNEDLGARASSLGPRLVLKDERRLPTLDALCDLGLAEGGNVSRSMSPRDADRPFGRITIKGWQLAKRLSR